MMENKELNLIIAEVVKEVEHKLIERGDERYVMVKNCNEKQTEVNNRFAKDDKRIDKLVDKFNTWDKLLWVIATAGIGALVLEFFGLILK